MKKLLLFFLVLFLMSCTSNTIYKKPKNLIPKDTMLLLLTDLSIASTAHFQKNISFQKKVNYISLVYEKFKIDSTRFKASNVYYMSKVEEYEELLKEAEKIIKKRLKEYEKEKKNKDSIKKVKRKGLKTLKTKKIKYKKELIKKITKQDKQRVLKN